MIAQVLGALLSLAGLLWFFHAWAVTSGRTGIAGVQQAVPPLWGLVIFLGGLILWGLGRIETTIAPLSEQKKTSGVISVFVCVLVGAALALFCWQLRLGRY